MDVSSKLTVFFEEPFWIGVYERNVKGKIEVSRVVFGPEPKSYEVYEYFMKNWGELRFSPMVDDEQMWEKRINPKRLHRKISSLLSQRGIGTKAQQALKLQQEQNALDRKSYSHQMTEEEKQRKFEIRMQKKKEKHKGR